ncbi:hypothetical protein [Baekduia sp. Peel2402]|uniref:hypothetical protein n=1 Tax=Baekduia sp. Peel2402 TaxID=3458296 RepID=UPI00403ED63F
MSRIARIVVLVTALTSLFAVMSSTAGAVTWTNTGSTIVHATGIGIVLNVGANKISCTGTTASATAPASFVGAVYSVPGTVTFSPCTLAGQNTYIHCGFTLTGTAFTEPSITTGVADVTCVQRLTANNTALCHIERSTVGHYINPTPATSTPGKITLTTSSSLVVTHSSGTSCLLGTGVAHLSEQTITVTTVAGSPIITRHP